MRGWVIAAESVPAAVRERLLGELAAAGVDRVDVIEAGDLARVRATSDPAVIVDERALVGRDELLLTVRAPGAVRALIARPADSPLDALVVGDRVELDPSAPNARFAGVVAIDDPTRRIPSEVGSLGSLFGAVDVRPVDARSFDPPRHDPTVGKQLSSLVTGRDGVRRRRQAAVKSDDNLWTTVAVSPWSQFLAAGAARLGWSPNSVTVASVVVAVAAAVGFATGSTAGIIAGALGVQLAFGLDCADGQLARLTGRFTALGAWLDWVSDRLKEVVLLAGIAVGADDGLVLGVAAIGISVLRAQLNQSFEDHRVDPAPTPSPRFGAVGVGRRFKNFLTFPYGDRMGMISIVALVGDLRWVLILWCGWNAFGAAYQLVGRLRRPTGPAAPSFSALVGDGPVGQRVRAAVVWPVVALALPLCLAVIAAVVATDQPIAATVLIAGAALAALPMFTPRGWLVPLGTVGVEMLAGLTLAVALDPSDRWIALVVVAVVGGRRLVSSTGARFGADVAVGPGWEARVVLGLALAWLAPVAVLLVAVVAAVELARTVARQFGAVTRP